MNILLINAPSRRGSSGKVLPLGLLYAAGVIERCGHNAEIIDPYLEDAYFERFTASDFEEFYKKIDEFKPSVVGYSGIATSYGSAKRLSLAIKKRYPHIFQIAGGPLSSVGDLLLRNTGIGMVFHGEAEMNLQVFLENFAKGDDIYKTPGTSYFRDGAVSSNPSAGQVADLDSIPMPPYHLVDMRKYAEGWEGWLDYYGPSMKADGSLPKILDKVRDRSYYLPILTARGCTHACLFCYRHLKGIRQHSVPYVINHMKYLKDKYAAGGFQFFDELFNYNASWVFELCDSIEKEGLGIYYLIGGARVDKIDSAMLKRLSETGCIEINYGQESGSDKILREYRKGVTAHRNKEITIATKKEGINCPIQLVIGGPGETNDTINDTVKFLKDVNAYHASLNYLVPLPKTPVWKVVEERGVVNDLEEYLDIVALRGSAMINLTTVPDRVFRNWGPHINNEMQLEYCRKNCAKAVYIKKLFILKGAEYLRLILPRRAVRIVKSLIESVKSLWK